MNAPEARRRRELGNVEILREGDTLIMRRIVDVKKFRAAAAAVLAHMPPPKKGTSVLRELEKSRTRRGR